MALPFSSRIEAGRRLGASLQRYSGRKDVLVVALPGGGLAVAAAVAEVLAAPLDVIVVRRLLLPGVEIAIGAVVGGQTIFNDGLIGRHRLDLSSLRDLAAREVAEIQQAAVKYRQGRPAFGVLGKTVLLIDDGDGDLYELGAAVRALRQQRPARLVMGFPAVDPRSQDLFAGMVDVVVSAEGLATGATALLFEGPLAMTEQEIRELLSAGSGGGFRRPAARPAPRSPQASA